MPRHAESLVAEALADTRVVLVNGARQSGKSTLTRLTAAKELTHEAPKPAKSPASPVTWHGADPGPDLDRA